MSAPRGEINIRFECLAGNIIRQEPPVHHFSASTSISADHALDWQDGVCWITEESHPDLFAELTNISIARGWRPGAWPGSKMPPGFKLHRQPDDWGGRNHFVTGIRKEE